ncbi:Qat anti-phage system TatD family nuclease QatD [Neobacillus sp. SCS-31]|uniref:Qat anti-phage system TatD family nuclease QatD n=1 Tax=Neobacillus oceani TaxID=3115292 RepID=UPI003905EB3F
MNQFYHDSHVHLDLYTNTIEIIREIEINKSYTIAVTNLPVLYEKAIKIYPNSKYVRFAAGLHPELVGKFPEQIPKLYESIKESRYIGEIGLDFSNENIIYKELQLEVFKQTMDICNSIGNKIVNIHSRGATSKVIEIVGSEFNGQVILHWFSGSIEDLKKAIHNGYFLSVNMNMLKTVSGQKIVNNIPLDRILIESDGPFTKPFKDNYNVSSIKETIYLLSKVKSVNLEELNTKLKNNFKNLLK